MTMTPWEFEHVFDGKASWNVAMRSARYWVRVESGRIVGLGDVERRSGA